MGIWSQVSSSATSSYDITSFSEGVGYTFEDWYPNSTNGILSWSTHNDNGGALTRGNEDQHLGTVECNTGTNTNGASQMRFNGTTQIGGARYRIGFYCKLSELSDGTNTYTATIGIAQGLFSTTAITDGVYFSYTHSASSGNWETNCIASSTATTADSGIAATTDWTYFEIEINADGTSISFFINGTEVSNSPITTNIPTSTDIYWLFRIEKSAGTSARSLFNDKFMIYYPV